MSGFVNLWVETRGFEDLQSAIVMEPVTIESIH